MSATRDAIRSRIEAATGAAPAPPSTEPLAERADLEEVLKQLAAARAVVDNAISMVQRVLGAKAGVPAGEPRPGELPCPTNHARAVPIDAMGDEPGVRRFLCPDCDQEIVR